MRPLPTWTPEGLRSLALVVLAFAVYFRNLDDYFIGDDFDLIFSFYAEPLSYFVKLLWSNESGTVWASHEIGTPGGLGYLRPVKIWLLKLDFTLWGVNGAGFHFTNTLVLAANVLAVYWMLCFLAPDSKRFALLGGFATAIHPVFSAVVPSITFREESLASGFALLSVVAFMRFRVSGGPRWPFSVLFGLALFSKESAVSLFGLALAYDLAFGHLRPDRQSIARELRLFAPVLCLLLSYFGLRWVGFAALVPAAKAASFLDPAAIADFHVRFLRSLVHRSMFAGHALPAVGLGVSVLAAAAVGWIGSRWSQLDRSDLAGLLFAGPLWYLCSTVILGGAYFATRHNIVPVVGLIMLGVLLLRAVLRCAGAGQGVQQLVVAAAAGLSALAFLPPTLRHSAEWDFASGYVERARRSIEEQTADLPAGSTIFLQRVPQYKMAPHYFGWGLQSALKRPFTATDLATRSLVINRRDMVMNSYRFDVPEQFDRVVAVEEDWPRPSLQRRRR